MSCTCLPLTNNHQRQRDPGHVADFGIFGPLYISKTAESRKLKFGVWLDYVGTSLRATNYPQWGVTGLTRGLFLPERDYVTFGYLPPQFYLSYAVCLSVCNVRTPYSAG